MPRASDVKQARSEQHAVQSTPHGSALACAGAGPSAALAATRPASQMLCLAHLTRPCFSPPFAPLPQAEKAGLSLSKIEKLGLLSTAERLGLLSLADELLVTDPGKVGRNRWVGLI